MTAINKCLNSSCNWNADEFCFAPEIELDAQGECRSQDDPATIYEEDPETAA